jgi:hypothetical protein
VQHCCELLLHALCVLYASASKYTKTLSGACCLRSDLQHRGRSTTSVFWGHGAHALTILSAVSHAEAVSCASMASAQLVCAALRLLTGSHCAHIRHGVVGMLACSAGQQCAQCHVMHLLQRLPVRQCSHALYCSDSDARSVHASSRAAEVHACSHVQIAIRAYYALLHTHTCVHIVHSSCWRTCHCQQRCSTFSSRPRS